MASDPNAMLADLEAMIAKVQQGAQEYNVGTRRTRYPLLSELYAARQLLMSEISQTSGMLTVGVRANPT